MTFVTLFIPRITLHLRKTISPFYRTLNFTKFHNKKMEEQEKIVNQKLYAPAEKKSNEQGGNICDTVIYSAQQALSKPRMQQQKSNERSQKAVVNGYCAMCMVLSIL